MLFTGCCGHRILYYYLLTPTLSSVVQCDDVGHHGTKILVYNLWHNDEGKMELDFESDPEVCIYSLWSFDDRMCFSTSF